MRFTDSPKDLHRHVRKACQHTRIQTKDFDQLRDWEKSHGIQTERRQLSRGSGSYEADFWDFDELFVWRYHEPHRFLHEFMLPRGTVEIVFAQFPDSLIWRGKKVSDAIAAIHFGGTSYESIVPAGAILYGFVLPETSSFAQRLLATQTFAPPLNKQAVATTDVGPIEDSLRMLDRILFRGTRQHGVFPRTSFIREICSWLFDASFQDGRAAPKKGLIDDARDLIKLHLSGALTVNEISEQLGTNRRTLERAFQSQLGLSPYQFLLMERLHAARSLLKVGEQSVLECCYQSGFEDASRFSSMYHRHFGENPSQTRGRNL